MKFRVAWFGVRNGGLAYGLMIMPAGEMRLGGGGNCGGFSPGKGGS